MTELIYATTNNEKVEILKRHLSSTKIHIRQVPIELDEPRADDVETIARAKALQAFSSLQKPLVVLDAGFFIEALNGLPGPYMNVFMKKIGPEGILRLLEGRERVCTFRKCLAYIDGQEPHLFSSAVKGTIADNVRGLETEPAPFNRLFIPDGESRALTELSQEEQVAWYANIPLRDMEDLDFRDWICHQ